MRLTAAIGALLMTLWYSTGPATADVVLPHVLSDHMVVQQGQPVQIWGWAEPGEDITVSIGDLQGTARADERGEWRVALPEMKAGGPYEITIEGRNKIVLRDVLVGEVWLCSGQSNMEMGLHAVENGEAECAAADHPRIRLFEVPQRPSGQPRPDVDATWQVCTPETVRWGPFDGFSAIAYFFGREIQKELDVPVGLIDTSWGGTRIEPWMPPEGFAAVPGLEPFVQEIADANEGYRLDVARALDPIQEWINATRDALQAGTEIPLRPDIPEHPLGNNWRPTGLYNGMIQPLVPFAIRGVLWYQGESNVVPYDEQYALKMVGMVKSWREAWGLGDFAFYYVQIAPFDLRNHGHKIAPTVQADLREQQAEAMALISNSGMIVTSDISNLRDIHPANKQDVGKRLALWALAKTYGREGVVYSGPVYKGMKVEGSKVRVEFDHVGGGLTSRDDKPLTWFELAGEDKAWHEAAAEIDGDSVVVKCPAVPKPVAVRFGWSMLAEPNLMNKEGLPAAQFRSEKW
ncbi:MAG: sialate O-acetylesterase [Verrucomicrobia bacterium]|nr:sialate O-acetylesterase [Verrucomicrobiota bacterium]